MANQPGKHDAADVNQDILFTSLMTRVSHTLNTHQPEKTMEAYEMIAVSRHSTTHTHSASSKPRPRPSATTASIATIHRFACPSRSNSETSTKSTDSAASSSSSTDCTSCQSMYNTVIGVDTKTNRHAFECVFRHSQEQEEQPPDEDMECPWVTVEGAVPPREDCRLEKV